MAAGVALVRAAGGRADVLGEPERSFNREDPLMKGLIAYPESLAEAVRETLTT